MTTALEHLLDRVGEALVSGNLAGLAGLDREIEAETAALTMLDDTAAARLQSKARRNAYLLQAAGRGLRAARDRVADIAAGPGLSTYDSHGRKAALAGPAAALGRF